MRTVLVALFTVAIMVFVGCSQDTNTQESGRVIVPISQTTADGTEYRLEGTILAGGIDNYVFGSTDEQFIEIPLPDPNYLGYTIELLGGWSLYRVEADDSLTEMDAILRSPNPVEVNGNMGSSIFVTFEFTVGDHQLTFDALNDDESISVDFRVDEEQGGLSMCPQGSYCLAGVMKNTTWRNSLTGDESVITSLPFAISWNSMTENESAFINRQYSISCPSISFDLRNLEPTTDQQAMFDAMESATCDPMTIVMPTWGLTLDGSSITLLIENEPFYISVILSGLPEVHDPDEGRSRLSTASGVMGAVTINMDDYELTNMGSTLPGEGYFLVP